MRHKLYGFFALPRHFPLFLYNFCKLYLVANNKENVGLQITFLSYPSPIQRTLK